MSKDNDLYGDDIRLWSEAQSALLRRLSAGEAVADQIDWPHVVEAELPASYCCEVVEKIREWRQSPFDT